MLNNDVDLISPQWEPARTWNPTSEDDTGSVDPFLYAGSNAVSDDGSVGSAGSLGSGSAGRDLGRRGSMDSAGGGGGGMEGGGYSHHSGSHPSSHHSHYSHQSSYRSHPSQHSYPSHHSHPSSHHSNHSYHSSHSQPSVGHYDHVSNQAPAPPQQMPQQPPQQHSPPRQPSPMRPMNRRGSNESTGSYDGGFVHHPASPYQQEPSSPVVSQRWHRQQSPPAGLAGVGAPPMPSLGQGKYSGSYGSADAAQSSRTPVEATTASSAASRQQYRRRSLDDPEIDALASFAPGPGFGNGRGNGSGYKRSGYSQYYDNDHDDCALYDCVPNVTRPFSRGFLRGKYGAVFVLALVGIFAHAEFGWRAETLRRANGLDNGGNGHGRGGGMGESAGRAVAVGGGERDSAMAKELEAKYAGAARQQGQQQQGPQRPAEDSRNMQAPSPPNDVLQSSNAVEAAAAAEQQQQQQQAPPPNAPSQPSEARTAVTSLGQSRPLPKVDPPPIPGLKDVWDAPDRDRDVMIFWHVPKAGGSTVKDIVGACHGKVVANEIGVLDGHDKDTKLAVTKIDGQGETLFVNVDTTTLNGIYRARDMGLGPSGLAGLIVTPFIKETSTLFDPRSDRKGRVFATFRHPLDRVTSLFKYLQYADWEPTYDPKLKDWSLEKYAESDRIENNWMTRHLTSTYDADLTDVHLAQAMEVMRTKIVVGLMNRMDETMNRFETYFGLTYRLNPTEQESCREGLFTVGTNIGGNTDGHAGADRDNYNKVEKPKPGTRTYELIMAQNEYDMELYKFAVNLFEEQEAFVKDQPEDFRFVGSTCSKCDEYEKEGREAARAEEREQEQKENAAFDAQAGGATAVAKRVLRAIME